MEEAGRVSSGLGLWIVSLREKNPMKSEKWAGS